MKADLRYAGAEWVDNDAVVDGNLVSARKPADIPAFNRAMIELFSNAQAREGHTRKSDIGSSQAESFGGKDPRLHVEKIKYLLNDVARHAREDVRKVSDPRAQALFETTAEGVEGLAKAFDDYEEKREEAWKTAGSL